MKEKTSVKNAQICISSIVVITILYYIPNFSKYKIVWNGSRLVPVLTFDHKNSQAYFIYNVPIYYTVIYIIPFTLLITLTVYLLRDLSRIRQRRQIMSVSKRDETDVTITLVAIVLVFMICQLANPVRRLVLALVTEEETKCGYFYFYLRTFTTCLVAVNSAVNFVVYCLCGRRFRAQFINIIKCFRIIHVTM